MPSPTEKKGFKTDQTFFQHPTTPLQQYTVEFIILIRFIIAPAKATKKKSRKYFHITELVCFGAKYIIDSASETTWISYRRRLKERAKKTEKSNVKIYISQQRKNQHHTRHLLKLRNHESWLHSTYTSLSFKLHLHLSLHRKRSFSETETGVWRMWEGKKNEYLIVQAKVRVSNHVHFLIPLENKISTKELKEYGKERNKNCWYIKCVMIHLWAIK